MTGSSLKDMEMKNLSDKLWGTIYPLLELEEGKYRDLLAQIFLWSQELGLTCSNAQSDSPLPQFWSKTKKPNPLGEQF